eukprot:TRINITY_DN807_c0_g1_i1.p1 TRINITY_DN807_c0_g1~~TRINITY_DN807_c0_g1_i1.p1  ORF type:complete len:295 (-),score=78.93 TRINITY_DN807_c0_g1_i1:46-930(-)
MVRVRIDEIGYKLQNNQVDLEYFVERGPPPGPIYDTNGKRVNTKDFRAKVKLMNERHILIEKALEINPGMHPPNDYQGLANTKTKKIYIPTKEFPDYNFIGLIIGPRGITQKDMENETGAKIAIRGKGSAKDGKVSNYGDGDDDDLHVLITGDTDASIRRASRKVKRLLTPIDEGQNEHKRKQLKKLAEINGTLRDNAFEPLSRTWTSSDVYCKHCGEISHPTSDCPMKNMPVDKHLIDSEYDSFMSEIGMNSYPYAGGSTGDDKDYEKFMQDIGSVQQPYYNAGYAPPPNPHY